MGLKRRFDLYLVRARNLAPLSAYTYLQSLDRLEKVTGKPVHKIGVRDLNRYMLSDYAPSTKNGDLVAFRSFHKWGALTEELWPLDQRIVMFQGPKIVKVPKAALSMDEAITVLRMCKRPNEFRAVWLPLFAGLRVSECARVGPREWRKDRIIVPAKGRRLHEVPVHEQLSEVRSMILRKQTTRDTLKAVVRSFSLVLGVPFSPHLLRHTFSRALRDEGIERAVIGALLGHAPLTTTEIYTPVTWREQVAAVRALRYEMDPPAALRSA